MSRGRWRDILAERGAVIADTLDVNRSYTEPEVSKITQIPRRTLQHWRFEDDLLGEIPSAHPHWYRRGSRFVLYDGADLARFLRGETRPGKEAK